MFVHILRDTVPERLASLQTVITVNCLATSIILFSPVLTVTEECLFFGCVAVSYLVLFVGKYL